ncbi:MAG: DUF4145 domain-containing protein [Bauldia sp.]|nr:DUF4145 domain-containing protein [Bauldia sp.]
MTDSVLPRIDANSFVCPHCNAIAHQDWFSVYFRQLNDNRTPYFIGESNITLAQQDGKLSPDVIAAWRAEYQRQESKTVFDDGTKEDEWTRQRLGNVNLSRCFSCKRFSIWLHKRLLWPTPKANFIPNPDLPEEVISDYKEAAAIVEQSPRGAAALLRLALQKLLRHLGKAGDNLNKDIADLVSAGLDVRIQQALDVVRVVGNNAVHPGQLDLRDHPETAYRLFGIVNLIADALITQPRNIESMFDALPDSSRAQIAARDRKKN